MEVTNDTSSIATNVSSMTDLHFTNFVKATTLADVLEHYKTICEVYCVQPTNLTGFYCKLKQEITTWKANSVWSKLDEFLKFPCYQGGKACSNVRVLIVGAGPCGLRAAIECQLLGAKVVVIEKRKDFSRSNVLHLWPFVIQDLRRLGIKTFVGKFCARAVEHISIRQLQLVLLKVALLLGVEFRVGVTCLNLIEPDHLSAGWRMNSSSPSLSQETFDVVIGATGKQGDILGFKKTMFRGKLAIAITANFINRHTKNEEAVPEISGVAYVFNQQFFKKLKKETGINLENILYFKDDTHYFIMTVKRECLLKKGVLIKDHKSPVQLLKTENVNKEVLQAFVIEAVGFATDYKMPHFDFAINTRGEPDVAIFDFTLMQAACNACKIIERKNKTIVLTIIGDNLLEPFWPIGSGCARGFLSALDAAWMVRNWASGIMTPLQVIAEREAVYKMLPQTKPDNLKKDHRLYTADPKSRYLCLNLQAFDISLLESLYDSDSTIATPKHLIDTTLVPSLTTEYVDKTTYLTDARNMSMLKPEETFSSVRIYESGFEAPALKKLSNLNIENIERDYTSSNILTSNEIDALHVWKQKQETNYLMIKNKNLENSKQIQRKAEISSEEEYEEKLKIPIKSHMRLRNEGKMDVKSLHHRLSHKEVKSDKQSEKELAPSRLSLYVKLTMVVGSVVALTYFWHLWNRK